MFIVKYNKAQKYFHINDFCLVLARGKTFTLLSLTTVPFKEYPKLASKGEALNILLQDVITVRVFLLVANKPALAVQMPQVFQHKTATSLNHNRL